MPDCFTEFRPDAAFANKVYLLLQQALEITLHLNELQQPRNMTALGLHKDINIAAFSLLPTGV